MSTKVTAFGRTFNVGSVFMAIKKTTMNWFTWDQDFEADREIYIPYISYGLQMLVGKIIGIHASEHGRLICIKNNKAKSTELKWDVVYIWYSHCGGASGILSQLDSNAPRLELRRTKGHSGFEFSKPCLDRPEFVPNESLLLYNKCCDDNADYVGAKFMG